MQFNLPRIQHNKEGFEALVHLHAQAEQCFLDDIEIDMKTTTWFDADMCAAFGAVLYRLGDNLNTVHLTNIEPRVKKILSKNGFLSHYGRAKVPDHWETAITYQRFDVKDDHYFSGYIENELIHRSELPEMSPALLRKFRESIFEMFSNAVLHSNTKLGIFSCGQFFPHRKILDFMVADLGIGIRQNIKNHLGWDFSSETAIVWATEADNTTKRGSVPGGLGLKLLCDFIDLNGGGIQIVSDAGYWRRSNRHTETALLRHSFPGTVVSLEINTADRHSYMLACETNVEDIL